MGVEGLWKLLSTAAVTMSLEDLKSKRLAIDTSIWLHQFGFNNVKILRFTFARICKLLFFDIKPIFVFDGSVPRLKRDTIQKRYQDKYNEEKRIKRIAKGLFLQKKQEKEETEKRNSDLELLFLKENNQQLQQEGENGLLNENDRENGQDSQNNNFGFYSFAKRGEEIGAVNFGALEEEDFLLEDLENVSKIEEDIDSEEIFKASENNTSNFFEFPSPKRRKFLRDLKEKVRRENNENNITLGNLSPKRFSLTQQKLILGNEISKESKLLKRILNFEDLEEKKMDEENGVIVKGSLASDRNTRFVVYDETKIVEKEETGLEEEKSNNEIISLEDDDDDDEWEVSEITEKKIKPVEKTNNLDNFFSDNKEQFAFLKELKEMESLEEDDDDDEDDEDDDDDIPEITRVDDFKIQQETLKLLEEEEESSKNEEELEFENLLEEISPEKIQRKETLSDSQHVNMSLVQSVNLSSIQLLLQILGIPWLQAPEECDSQVGYLFENKLIDGVITEDSDVFLFGAGKVYKDFFKHGKFTAEYNMESFKNTLGLTREKLIQLSLLLGSDYTMGVKNIGIVTATQITSVFNKNHLQQKFEDNSERIRFIQKPLEEFKKWVKKGFKKKKTKKRASKVELEKRNFMKKYENSRKRYVLPSDFPSQEVIEEYLNPKVDKSKEEFSFGEVNMKELYKFCETYMFYSRDEVDKIIKPCLERNKSNQQVISKFFTKRRKIAEIKSKRLSNAVNFMVKEKKKEEKKKKKRIRKEKKKALKKRKTTPKKLK